MAHAQHFGVLCVESILNVREMRAEFAQSHPGARYMQVVRHL